MGQQAGTDTKSVLGQGRVDLPRQAARDGRGRGGEGRGGRGAAVLLHGLGGGGARGLAAAACRLG